MKLKQFIQSSAVILLLGVFFYATTIKEFHYVFASAHHADIHSDNCNHHLHATEHFNDCQICKIDLSTGFNTQKTIL